MKKLISLLLALCLTLCMSAACFGETAEPAEAAETAEIAETTENAEAVEAAPQYANFPEHVQAYLNNIDLLHKDVVIALQNNGNNQSLKLGVNDEGVFNIVGIQNDEVLANLQIGTDAAYLNYQGNTMAVKFETIQNFIKNLPQKLAEYAKALGIDAEQQAINAEQLKADLQTLMAKYQEAILKIAPAIKQSIDGNIVTITLDGENSAEIFADAAGEYLTDASVQDIMVRYLAMFGIEFDPAVLTENWTAAREQMIALIKTWQFKFTIDQTTGDFTVNADVTLPDNRQTCDLTGKFNDAVMTVNGEYKIINGENELKYDVDLTAEKNSFFLSIPTKVTEHLVLSANGEETATVDMNYELSDFGLPMTYSMIVSAQGQEIINAQYADSTVTVTFQGQEMLFGQFKDNVLTLRLQGTTEVTVKQTEADADHETYEVNVKNGDQTATLYVIGVIGPDGNGGEFVTLSVMTADQQIIASEVIAQVEKEPFALLKDAEPINWITEEQLNALLDQAFADYLNQIMSSLSPAMDGTMPESVEEVPAEPAVEETVVPGGN